MTDIQTSVHGKALGLGEKGQLIAHEIEITRPCVNATILVGPEAANARAITIQLLDAYGNDIDYVETVEGIIFTTAARTAFATATGSTGIAIGTDGAIRVLATGTSGPSVFLLTSESDGDIDLTWTDTGTDAAFLGLRLPNGRIVMSDALTNA